MFGEEGGGKIAMRRNHTSEHGSQRLDLESISQTLWRFQWGQITTEK